jgi:hypothetical protein
MFYPARTVAQQIAGQTVPGTLTIGGALTVTTGGAAITGALSATGHISGTSTGVAAAAGANAGTSPPAPVLAAGSSDTAGNGTFGTGTTPAAGAQVGITFGTSYGSYAPGVSVQPSNAAAAALGLYPSAVTGTGFTVSCTGTPTGSEPNTTYAFTYLAVGG